MIKYIIPILIAGTFFLSCTGKVENVAVSKEPLISDSLSKIISIDTVRYDYMIDQLSLSGEVGNDENKIVKIYPNASGQVVSVNVSLGSKVQKGQTLAVIKSADVAGNYADLNAANTDASIAEKEYKNAEQLYNNGISSQKEFIQARLQYQKAMSAVNKVRSQIAINGGGRTSASGTYIVTAPRDGYVVEKNINAGSFIRNDNNQNLFTISDLKDVWIWANVFEPDIHKIKKGGVAEITTLSYPDRVFHGTIDQVNTVLDPVSKTMKVKIILPNDSMLLKPQMFTKIMIIERQQNKALVIPSSAVVFDGGKNYVLLYIDKYNIKPVTIEILKNAGDRTYIKEGLKEGDMVIAKNPLLLFNSLMDQ